MKARLLLAIAALFIFPFLAIAEDISDEEFAKKMETFLAKDGNVEKITDALKRFVQTQEKEQRAKALEQQFDNPIKIAAGNSPSKGKKRRKNYIG